MLEGSSIFAGKNKYAVITLASTHVFEKLLRASLILREYLRYREKYMRTESHQYCNTGEIFLIPDEEQCKRKSKVFWMRRPAMEKFINGALSWALRKHIFFSYRLNGSTLFAVFYAGLNMGGRLCSIFNTFRVFPSWNSAYQKFREF